MNFIHSLKDKAQTYLPPATADQQATGTGSDGSLTGDETQKQTNPALTGLSHALRTLQVQHFPNAPQSTRNLQIGITAQKGVALDYDTVARDSDVNGQKLYNWVGALEGHEGEVGLGFEAKTLISMSSQLGPLHHKLSQSLLAARQPLKNLRNAEVEIYTREQKVRPLEAKLTKVAGRAEEAETRAELERLENEIKELSYGLPDLRVEALREGQRLSWAAYKQFASDLLLLSHAAESLVHHLPQTASDLKEKTGGDKTQKTDAERKAREHLAGNSGWTVSVNEKGTNVTGSYGSSAPSVPVPQQQGQSAVSEKPRTESLDHLNNSPAPLPTRSSPPLGTEGTPASALPPPTHPDSALRHHEAAFQAAPPAPATDLTPPASTSAAPEASPSPSHPTMAETGIPLAAGTNGPSHGQLERRSNDMPVPGSTGQGIVRLSSFGGEGITSGRFVPEPGMPQDTSHLANPFDGEIGNGKEPAAAPVLNPFADAAPAGATGPEEARRLKREEAQREAERQIQEAQLRASAATGASGLAREQTLPRYEADPNAAPVSDVKQ